MKAEKRFDNLLYGLIPGILLPMAGVVLFWVVRSGQNLLDFLSDFQQLGMLSKVITLSAIPNLLLFFLYIWTDRNFSARGVIFATLVLAFVMLVLKLA